MAVQHQLRAVLPQHVAQGLSVAQAAKIMCAFDRRMMDQHRAKCLLAVLIHHPPVEGAHYFRRLRDAEALRNVLRQHGAELVLHGHHHTSSLAWLPGPEFRIPVAGVPSASVAPGRHHDDPAGYHLYEVDGAPGDWRCTLVVRGFDKDAGRIIEKQRQPLIG